MSDKSIALCQAIIDVLQLHVDTLSAKLLEDQAAYLAAHQRATQAMFTLLEIQQQNEDPTATISWSVEQGDNTSRLDLLLDFTLQVIPQDDLPEYLPRTIFAELHGKTVDEMKAILRGYGMPDVDIKPFLRRIFPADDAL